MLYLTAKRSEHLIIDVGRVFSELTYGDIKPYIPDLLQYNAFTAIQIVPDAAQKLSFVGCTTPFGVCSVSRISTSVQILILSKIAIARGNECCFIAGQVGDNYLMELEHICKDSELISLYCPEYILPQRKCPAKERLEEELRRRKQP